MKKVLFVMAFTTLFAAGCQIFDFAPDFKKELKVFTGIIADDATRTALVADGDAYHVTWALGDRIMINGECEFTATVGDVTSTYFVQDTTGNRPDEPPTGPYKAVYPYTVGRGMPGVQNYAGNNVEILPMYAESNDETLAFKNMVGILKLNIRTTETGIIVKKIVITADQPMSGEYTVENSAAVISSGTSGVTLNCSKGVAISNDPVPFLVTVPANTYTGMTIKVYTTDGKVASLKMKSGASVKVERSKIYDAEFPINVFTAQDGIGGNALLPEGTDFNTIIKQLVFEDDLVSYSNVDETAVTRIVFNNLCADTEGLEIHDLTSEKPIYLLYDKTSGVVSINSPAETLFVPENGSYMFSGFGSLEYIDNLKCLNTEKTEDMSRMFYYVKNKNRKLRQLDLSSFNTSNVSTFLSMFNGCRSLEKLDVSNFDTSNADDISYMFQHCASLKTLDCSSFNTENVTTMSCLFNGCTSLESVNVSSFNTENCMILSYLFYNCQKIQTLDLSSFDTANCKDFYAIFRDCRSLIDLKIPNFDISNATDLRGFFRDCHSLQVVDVSMLDGSHMTKNNGWFFYHDYNLREIYAGEKFNIGKTNAFIDKFDGFEHRAGSVAGGLTIYCDQNVANYLSTTALRWIHSGYCTNGDVAPIPVVFKHYKNGTELSVEWPAN